MNKLWDLEQIELEAIQNVQISAIPLNLIYDLET